MYKLMIKTHNVTGLKYLCITKRIDHCVYTGSGSLWKKHLDEYGNDFSTEVIFRSDDYGSFVEKCLYYSELYDIVSSDDWANRVPESGYNNNDGKPNVVLFWESASEDEKLEIIARRSVAIKKNHWTRVRDINEIDEIKSKLSKKSSTWWKSKSPSEKAKLLESLWEGRRDFYDAKDDRYDKWKSDLSESIRSYHMTVDKSIISERNRQARLNTSDESKAERKKKIQEVYKSGKHDALFERYSIERRGKNNPAAVRVSIDGVVYGTIKEAVESVGVARSTVDRRLKSNKWKTWYKL